jgi:predicted PurR-regulated permease PerM
MTDSRGDREALPREDQPRRRPPYRTILTSIWLSIGSLLFLALLFALRRVLFYLVIAAFLALVLDPAVTRVVRFGLKRGTAILLVSLAAFVVTIGLFAGIVAPLAGQAVQFAARAPQYLKQAETGKGPLAKTARRFHLEGELRRASPAISRSLARLPVEILNLFRRIASGAFAVAIVVVLAIFMLFEGPAITKGTNDALPLRYREPAREVGRVAKRVIAGYSTGIFILALLNGAVTAIALSATRVPFVPSLAIWAGLVDMLPIVGGLIAIVPAALFAFGHSLVAGIVVVAAMLVYQQVKNHALLPIVVGRAVDLNPLFTLIAVLAGAELRGVVGALLAIPVAASLQAVAGVLLPQLARRGAVPEPELKLEVPKRRTIRRLIEKSRQRTKRAKASAEDEPVPVPESEPASERPRGR